MIGQVIGPVPRAYTENSDRRASNAEFKQESLTCTYAVESVD